MERVNNYKRMTIIYTSLSPKPSVGAGSVLSKYPGGFIIVEAFNKALRQTDLPRTVKNQTATGIAMKTRPRQAAPRPANKAEVGSLLPPMSILAPGIKLTTEVSNPQKQLNNPGQPQITAVTMVTIRPVFLSMHPIPSQTKW